MNDAMSRRHLLKVLTLISAGPAFFSTKGYSRSILQTQTTGKALVISSSNGLRSTEKAMQLIQSGSDALDAVIAGVNIIEDDPHDMSVGLGGLPNEIGEVELDASVMHGPSHRAGAVAALRN